MSLGSVLGPVTDFVGMITKPLTSAFINEPEKTTVIVPPATPLPQRPSFPAPASAEEQKKVEELSKEALEKRKRVGRKSTILTSGLGVQTPDGTRKRTLLGG